MTSTYISSTSSCSSSLDSKKHNRNGFCGRWSLRGHVQEGEEKHWRYGRLGCKRWTCPRCGPKKAKRLRRAIINKAQEKDLSRVLTLTLDPSSCSPEQSITYIRQCWNKFRTSLKRHSGLSIAFITILELQRSGYAHLHILVDRYIAQQWISVAWQAVGGGKIVDIRRVDIHRVAPYLSKYLTKDLLLTDFKQRVRRYTTSRDIVLFVKSSTGAWALLKAPIEFLYHQCRGLLLGITHDAEDMLQGFQLLAQTSRPPV